MSARTLLSLLLVLWAVALGVAVLIDTTTQWLIRQESLGYYDVDMESWYEHQWQQALLRGLILAMVAGVVVLRSRELAASLLPPSGPGQPGIRPWLEVGVAWTGLILFVDALVVVGLQLIMPFDPGNAFLDMDFGFAPPWASLITAGLLMLFPRVSRAFVASRPSDAEDNA